MITDYNGPANSKEIFPFTIGERIVSCFVDNFPGSSACLWIVLESGDALCCSNLGGGGCPAFWRGLANDVKVVVDKRKEEIARMLAELGVDSPTTSKGVIVEELTEKKAS